MKDQAEIDRPARKSFKVEANLARMAFLLRTYMRLRGEAIEVSTAATTLDLPPSTVRRVLEAMQGHDLAMTSLAPAVPGRGPGRGRLNVWSIKGTLQDMERAFAPMPDVAEQVQQSGSLRAYPDVFSMCEGRAIEIPPWKGPTSTLHGLDHAG